MIGAELGFSSSASQVNDGIWDIGGGVFINPTVAPQVAGGQGGASALTSQGMGEGTPGLPPKPTNNSSPATQTVVPGDMTGLLQSPVFLIAAGILIFVLVRR